jgi:hypothetical protein
MGERRRVPVDRPIEAREPKKAIHKPIELAARVDNLRHGLNYRLWETPMALKRPRFFAAPGKGKRKCVDPHPDQELIKKAASEAVFSRGDSDYHCEGPGGRKPKRRRKYSSVCPKKWSETAATKALRKALAAGQVSPVWENGFPRHVWHRDGDTVYEARHTRGPHGTYHAYPIEKDGIPIGFTA